MTESRRLPSWIVRPDGVREPFDAEAVFRTLFHATSQLGDPDTFRARELADAVLHFLAESEPGETAECDSLRDTVVKVVRELGHVSLARLLAESPDPPVTEDGAATDIFPPEIIAAERSGLLALGDCWHGPVLAGSVVVPQLPGGGVLPGMLQALQEARRHTGGYVAIDSPEYLFRTSPSPGAIHDWVAELREGLRRTGLRAVVNLNCRTPPAWAVTSTGGLFPPDAQAQVDSTRQRISLSLLGELAAGEPDLIRVDWHLCDSDLHSDLRPRLLHVCARIREGATVGFVPDRPRRVVALAEGLDREHPAVVSVVGARVDGLARYLLRSMSRQEEALMRAMSSLASLARSAGNSRLRYLRANALAGVAPGFLLDRGRLLVVPLGLRWAVQTGMRDVADETDAQQQLLRALFGGVSQMPSLGPPTVLDSAPPGSDLPPADEAAEPAMRATPQNQLRRAASLQGDTQTGTAVILLPAGFASDVADLAGLIEYAYRLRGLVRYRFVPPGTDSPTPATG